MPSSIKKTILFLGAAALTLSILSISYFRIPDRFELVTLDFRYNLRLTLPQKINQDIALIEIGEDTLASLGRWPLPRDYHASLIDVLKKSGARMIIFDILFCEPTGWDGLLVKSAANAGNVYFPFAFRQNEKVRDGIQEAAGIDAPLLKELAGAAGGMGFINKTVDMDGKVRRAPFFIKYKDHYYPSMVFKVACDYMRLAADAVSYNDRGNFIILGNKKIFVDEEGAVLLNFAGRWADAFSHYSYVDILASYKELSAGKTPRIDLGALKGKVCFVGLTATGTQELGPIPIEKSYPMMGIHANVFNMLTEGLYPRRAPRAVNLAILCLLSMGLFFAIRRKRPFNACLISLGAILFLSALSIALFVFAGLWIDMVYPSMALLGLYLALTITRYISEIRVREKMQRELAVAASIQRCFLPEEVPSIEGLDIAVAMKTAKEVGGDLYDFVKLDDARLGIMIGDVSGKGVPAALFMARVETLFRVYSKMEGSAVDVVAKLNREVASDERSGLFTTLAYALFDIKNRRVLVADAGHLPLIFMHEGKIEKLASEDGMAIGIMEEATFGEKSVALSKGDIIIFYTDGVSEARDIKGNEFGSERLTKLINDSKGMPAQEIIGSILKDIRQFQGRAVQHDDITIIAVKIY